MPKFQTFTTTKTSPLETEITKLPTAPRAIILMNQTHSNNIKIIENASETNIIENTDALITTQENILLIAKHADCLPILIFHPTGLIAAIHAGRAGTQKEITKKTLSKIKTDFSLSQNFTIHFGPALCKPCHRYNQEKDLYYDLITENKSQAESAAQIAHWQINQTCTKESTIFHSYRAGDKTLRNHSGILFRNP